SARRAGVAGTVDGPGAGVLGTAGSGTGVSGVSTGGVGVLARSATGTGLSASSGSGVGVAGTSAQGTGVTGRGGGSNPGVQGSGGTGPGVSGTSTQGAGVSGASDLGVGVTGKGGGANAGVAGTGGDGPGVLATSTKGAGLDARSTRGAGVTATGATGLIASGSTRAAYLDGDVVVTGTLSDSGSRTRIDHPLTPDSHYLVHAAVQSPELKNVYDGTVTLDARGRATVELPEWFESVNESFRYQLTAVGGPAPDLHVSRPLTEHTFAIAGGAAGLHVCWQVTGVRCDGWARTAPLAVEEEKPAEERGLFVHPEAVGRPPEFSLSARVTSETRVGTPAGGSAAAG
ncbi:hypothetical protein ACWEPZ_35145, partial [Streptomyces sp. NPDC004288]